MGWAFDREDTADENLEVFNGLTKTRILEPMDCYP